MLRAVTRLRNEENGFIIAAELILIATMVVLALVVGLSVVRQAIINELVDVADSFSSADDGLEPSGRHDRTDRHGGDRRHDRHSDGIRLFTR